MEYDLAGIDGFLVAHSKLERLIANVNVRLHRKFVTETFMQVIFSVYMCILNDNSLSYRTEMGFYYILYDDIFLHFIIV